MAVMVMHFPNRARDLLAYMALIIRTAKRFGGMTWRSYDRAFRRDAAASNNRDWSAMRPDLDNYHTAVVHCPTIAPSPPINGNMAFVTSPVGIHPLRCTKPTIKFIRLNKPSRLDLQWWNEFLPSWNGISFFDLSEWAPVPDFALTTDASGSKGIGALIMMSGLRHPGCPRNSTWVWLTRSSILLS